LLIISLPFHPLPKPKDSIGRWIVRLARANKVSFGLILNFIAKYAKRIGFIQALSDLTRLPVEQIITHSNEFKSEFWNNLKECPIKNCDFARDQIYKIFLHLHDRHNFGVTWYNCPLCEYKAKLPSQLREHISNIHVRPWFDCPFCGAHLKSDTTLKSHLDWKHNIGFRIKWYNCKLCGYRTSSIKLLKIHLQDDHFYEESGGIKLRKCPICNFGPVWPIKMKIHLINKHNLSLWYKCLWCNYEINVLSDLLSHLQQIHRIEAQSRFLRFHSENPHFRKKICPFCGYKTHYNIFLPLHLKKVHGVDLKLRQYTQKRAELVDNIFCIEYLL